MDIFENREKAFEAEFTNKQLRSFRILALRNSMIAEDTAKSLGLKDQAAKEYVSEIINLYMKKPCDLGMADKIAQDLTRSGQPHTREKILERLVLLATMAEKQIAG